MRKLPAWFAAATLCLLASGAVAQNDVLKPYVVLILDTSGSMAVSTGSGPTSCGKQDNRINHAVCAINNIVNSYGDMVFSLSRFRETTTGTFSTSCDANGNQNGNQLATLPNPSGGDQCNTQGAYCADCNPVTGLARSCTYCTSNAQCPGSSCNMAGHYCNNNRCSGSDTCDMATALCIGSGICTNSDRNFEVLTPLVDGNNASAAEYTDSSCNTCGVSSTGSLDPEIWGVSPSTYTPLSATLLGDKRYWQGNQASDGTVIWPSNQTGYDPINRDPANAVFLTGNDQSSCNANPSTCTAFVAEVACTGTADDDGDGRINDGCAAVGPAETACNDNVDDDNDGTVNDGCQAWCAGTNCCCTSQCRPYITILLTDGDETCTTFANTLSSASSLLATTPRNDAIMISTAVRAANVVTITTLSPHAFQAGNVVVVSGITDMSFNNTAPAPTFTVVSVPSATTLTYAQVGPNASSSNGTIRHVASSYSYRVQTKPIGFGIVGPNANIEDMAHAGGAPDLPNVNEGFYANDEADLELAISQILADSVRSESCNERDDDCDVRVDEDFPTKGGTCTNGQLGNCAQTGVLECRPDGTGLRCTAQPVTPGNEGTVCNQMDDDCDGRVDEGLSCTTCVPIGELCNNKDDDCDTLVDEGLTRQCGQNACIGIETCTTGTWGGCTAPPSSTEVCDGRDNDCDGVCDGFQRECSDIVTPGGPGTDNPGHPTHNPIAQNICRPGASTCPVLCNPGNNQFGACSGEVKPCNGQLPCTDPCNGLDDDCDNLVDEDFQPADCSNSCGIGTTACTNGVISCNSQPTVGDTTCNNIDDDCDGFYDEDWICANPINGQCPCGQGLVCDGLEACVNGQVVCQGVPVGTEACNCKDDDCDTFTDEGTLCPVGSTCTNCQCAFPCAAGEFPCPLGKKCENSYCVNDPCYQVTCPPTSTGDAQSCRPKPSAPNEPECVRTCNIVPQCPATQICFGPTGECKADDCTTFPNRCSDTQACVAGQCIDNPCAGVTCAADKYCIGGTCVPSCSDVTCPTGQRCQQGMCETDPCGHACPYGQVCHDDDKMCDVDPCKDRTCPSGKWCNPNNNQCQDDPCLINAIQCPNPGELCRGGTCVDPDDLRPDAWGAAHVTVGGGGGCSTGSGGGWGVLLGLALVLRRRRRLRATRLGGGAE